MSPTGPRIVIKEKSKPGPFAPPVPPPGAFRHARVGGKVRPPTPELDRRTQAIADGHSQEIGEFIEWLKSDSGFVIGQWVIPYENSTEWKMESRLDPVYVSTEKLLAMYFGLDLNAIAREQEMLLRHIREVKDQ